LSDWVLPQLFELCLVSSITFPFIHSNRTEFYFSISVRSVMRTRHGNGNGNGATERQCGYRLRKRLRKRIRMNGNVTLETRISQLFAGRPRLRLQSGGCPSNADVSSTTKFPDWSTREDVRSKSDGKSGLDTVQGTGCIQMWNRLSLWPGGVNGPTVLTVSWPHPWPPSQPLIVIE